MCSSKYCPICTPYMLFSSWMWLTSSSGSPSSDTRSMQRCRRYFRVSLEREEQSVDPEQSLCGCWGTSWSILSPVLQQSVSLHPSPSQPGFACSTSRSSMLSETALTLGGGFSKVFLMPSIMVSSCWETCCRRWVTEAARGLSGCWVWHQHHIALWREHKEATVWDTMVQRRDWDRQLLEITVFNTDQNKRGSWCFCAKHVCISQSRGRKKYRKIKK